MTDSPPDPGPGQESRPLLEVGWLLADRFEDAEQAAIEAARDLALARLRGLFPRFEWRMPLAPGRRAAAPDGRAEAALLLEQGLEARERRRWDFALVLTRAELQSYYKPFALDAPSQALGVAALSVARLLPETDAGAPDGAGPRPDFAGRLCALALHLLGDLNNLGHRNEAGALMRQPRHVDELDDMRGLDAAERDYLGAQLADVADLRLEERASTGTDAGAGPGVLRFYLRAAWHARDDIFSAVTQAHPWEFPLRLSRLTTAALSTLLVLIMTAEAWDLGMSQPLPLVGTVSLLALAGASVFILLRQKLWIRRGRPQPTEQEAVGNIAICAVVFCGMSTTYLLLLLLTLALAALLFSPDLVANWAASVTGGGGRIVFGHYLAMAQLVATFGILIGSLGASFEGQYYFRHVLYVDEEL